MKKSLNVELLRPITSEVMNNCVRAERDCKTCPCCKECTQDLAHWRSLLRTNHHFRQDDLNEIRDTMKDFRADEFGGILYAIIKKEYEIQQFGQCELYDCTDCPNQPECEKVDNITTELYKTFTTMKQNFDNEPIY